MGSLIKFGKDGKPVRSEFKTADDFHDALATFLVKAAGPRNDGKLSQLEYAEAKFQELEQAISHGSISRQRAAARVRKIRVIIQDISHDLRHARVSLENLNGKC